MQNKMKVAIYCRVARKDAEEIIHQEKILRNYANEKGYRTITLYADNGYSGLALDRPAFSQMMKDIEAGMISAVLTKNIACIGRNVITVAEWLSYLQQHDISLLLVPDSTYFDVDISSSKY